jgi:hypothetical protein
LAQISAYWGGIKCVTIANGVAHTRLADGTVSKAARTFDWDGAGDIAAPAWARAWIEIHPNPAVEVSEQPAIDDIAQPLWGGALGTPGYTLGQLGATPADVLAMRNLFQQLAWHPEHVQMEWLIMCFDDTSLPDPGGVAHNWSVFDGVDTQIAARDAAFRYWSLSPAYNNVYAGNPDNFPTYADSVALGTLGPGDPDSATAWGAIALPNGDAYTGDSSNFPASVLLMDDGSIPA